MRRVLVVALAAGVGLAACGGSKGSSVSTVTFAGGSSSSPASSAAASAASTSTSPAGTSAATTTVTTAAASTTTTLPVTTSAPNVPSTEVLPSNVSPPTTVRNTAASPDDEAIFATYRATWEGYVWTASHPDDPRWDWLDKTIEPGNRAAWRKDIEDRWAKGQVLNADLGLTVNPHVYDRTPSRTYLFDCRTSGLYWVDKATGEPVAGEQAAVRPEGWNVAMALVSGRWLTAAAGPDPTDRRVAECGA